jgi:hypothetical protein
MAQMHECGRGRRKRTIPGSKADCRSCQIEASKVELARGTYDRIARERGASFAQSKAPQLDPALLNKAASLIAVACIAAFMVGYMTGGLGR